MAVVLCVTLCEHRLTRWEQSRRPILQKGRYIECSEDGQVKKVFETWIGDILW